ncbi:sensor histidine kinase, partial [Tessaracoccus lubricantis]
RTLHDALSGTVGVVVAQTGAAEVLWRSRPDQAKAALEVVAEAVAHARVDLERVALGPAPQQRPGLAEIPGLVRRMRDAGIDVVLVALPASAPQEAGAAAYRIVQECLANVARHAPGAAAEVHVALRDGDLSISVSDDGPGLSPTDRGGYGLTGLRERVGLLGGRLTLDSTPPGLRVLARLPIRQEVA